MADSYRKINYTLRPAKSIERKMLVELIRRLSVFGSLESYRYIGFGSIYFSDFSLFHKSLGFKQMINIEKPKEGNPLHEKRFEFNRPYGFIKLEFGESWKILPTLRWADIRTVLWLDYDGIVSKEHFRDIDTFFSSAITGSFFSISYNIEDYDLPGSTPLERLVACVGQERVPKDIDEFNDLVGWQRAEVFRRIINNEIQEILKRRNGTLSLESQILYKQVVNFIYRDGAMMATIGGVICDKGQEGLFENCGFRNLDFYKAANEPWEIQVPCLTFREIRMLDSRIPIPPAEISTIAIPDGDIKKYEKVYKYFPNFTESEF